MNCTCENCTHLEGYASINGVAVCSIYGEKLIKSNCPNHELKTDTFHPSRYGGDSKYECIKVLKEWMTVEEYRGFCRGNAIKYLCRIGKKDDPDKELDKAAVYIGFLKETYQD